VLTSSTARFLWGDALELIPTLQTNYDLTLMIDVLFEHFTKADGQRLLAGALAKSKSLLVSVPCDLGNQGEVFGNQHETHRAEWTAKELLSLAPGGFRNRDDLSHIVLLGGKAQLGRLRRTMDPPAFGCGETRTQRSFHLEEFRRSGQPLANPSRFPDFNFRANPATVITESVRAARPRPTLKELALGCLR
jgi:hypothetical protein